MGTYYDDPILWRCIAYDENGPLILSDKILCMKAFDAAGDNEKGSHKREYNNGYYKNITSTDASYILQRALIDTFDLPVK